jgi:hypothetical protein
MLRSVIASLALLACLGASQVFGQDHASQVLYKYLSQRLTMANDPAGSAQRQLQYWLRHASVRAPSVHRVVRAADGKSVDVILLKAPAWDWPNVDFSMAVVLKEGRIIDWRSCWTSRRTALISQDLVLEDVDGDGLVDVSFRMTPGSDVARASELRCFSFPGQSKCLIPDW